MSAHAPKGEHILDDLRWRGLLKDCTDEPGLRKLLGESKSPVVVYAGFDPTGPSLHVGHLVPLMLLARLQKAGLRPIAVAGGATGMVGDPSGKKSERTLLTEEVVRNNVARISKQLAALLDFNMALPNPAKLANNLDWIGPMSAIAFMRDVGKHFSVNMMLQKESVKARVEDPEAGISYTEFSYMILQSIDFLHLRRAEKCVLQVGGSDQWGNITAGIDLIRREGLGEGFGLTVPLLTRPDGSKFGKSEAGDNVWLDPTMTSPYQFYQFWVRADDRDAIKLLKYFTFLEHATIEGLERGLVEAPEKREAQKRLAFEMTRLIHGLKAAESAIKASKTLFGGEVEDLGDDDWRMLAGEIPFSRVDRSRLEAGLSLVDLLAETGVCPSKGQARKDIASGGVYVNNERESDDKAHATVAKLREGRYLLLRKGKKQYHLVDAGGGE